MTPPTEEEGHEGGGLQLTHIERATALRYAFLGNSLPIAIAVATDFDAHRTIFFIGAIAAFMAPLIVNTVSRRHPIPFYLAAFGGIPALTMMQAYSGGAGSGYSILVMMAMVWFGIQGRDREVITAIGLLTLCSYLPMLIFGPPAYPVEWGYASLLVIIGATVAGSLRTVTRQTVRLTARLRREAIIDELTGVLNRRGWEEMASAELARASRSGKPIVLATVDLDGLKVVNDTKGHNEGDGLIRDTAQRMLNALREGDIIARLGGDEFAALLPDASLDDGLEAMRRLKELTPDIGGFSAGVVAWTAGEDLHETLRRADVALGGVKMAGGGRIEIGPSSLDPHESTLMLDQPPPGAETQPPPGTSG